jgi:hypothetical protein
MASNPSAFTATPASIGAAPASAVAWQPSDNGLLAANADPYLVSGAIVLAAGTLYLIKIPIRTAIPTVTNIELGLSASGAGASSGSFTGLYSSTGTLLSGSADIGTALAGAAGPLTLPLSAPPAAAAPFVWVAMLANLATTQPTLTRAQGLSTIPNVHLAPASLRFAANGTGLSSLPASITPGSNIGAGGINIAAGLS